MMHLAINNAMIVTDKNIFKGSIGIQDGKVELISQSPIEADKVIQGDGKYLFPGIIDNHVHLNDPGFTWREDFAHGTKAAAIGGVTTIVDMPMQNEPAVSNAEIFEIKAKHVSSASYIDYSFWGALVDYNRSDIKGLRKAGAKAFKSFMCPVGKDYTSLFTGQIRDMLEITKSMDALAGFHCEDYNIIAYEEQKARREGRLSIKDYLKARPLSAEIIATQEILEIAREKGAQVHICHVSHRDVVDMIHEYRNKGVEVSLETCPHYLIFTEEDVIENGNVYKCSPPIREKNNLNLMWEAIENDRIDCIVSDHSPSQIDEKAESLGAFDAWGGISGLQTGLMTMYNEGVVKRGLEPTFIARTMAKRPAELFGLGAFKGQIQIGYDADLVLLDPKAHWEITDESLAYLNKFSAFTRLKGKGKPVMTILRGEIIVENGALSMVERKGQLIRC
ncbi:allantoinase AllB [Anaerosacchariphilus polymeriproducens]|uniref:allantoinase n=1 Tax=Anaerosacchariphilus polymeriproducens TaxID=1812858 RepID=A0A371AWY9_9FIRM|nr:allantoinase AllB [Anaerosacchariphilus polymeriproducens]RDU24095.1 allantoinase AllB [Anaerosacchariphilus polymeriproducens]